MAYIGQNAEGNFTTTNAKDRFSGDGSTTAFTLSQTGTTNNVDVFVNNVRQEPTVSYSVASKTLTFTAAPSTGTNNIYVVHKGPAELSATHPKGLKLEAFEVETEGKFLSTGGLPFWESVNSTDSDYTVPSNRNAVALGPLTINSTITVNGVLTIV